MKAKQIFFNRTHNWKNIEINSIFLSVHCFQLFTKVVPLLMINDFKVNDLLYFI